MDDFCTYTRIDLDKESFKFSSGHFTIFSRHERENIHGHNFKVSVAFDALIKENGMIFDYKLAKDFIQSVCNELDEYFLLPQHSPYITIHTAEDYIYVHFNDEKIPFLKRDIKIIPVTNITVEELSGYILRRFVTEFIKPHQQPIAYANVRVFSGPGQSANATWRHT